MTKNQKLIVSLLKEIRGHRTQIEVSRAMGYKYNYFNKLETLQKKISWTEFYNLTTENGFDFKNFLMRYLSFTSVELNFKSSAVILKQFLNIYNLKVKQLPKKGVLSVHPVTLQRWLKSKSLSLEIMLSIFDLKPEFKTNFIDFFSTPRKLNQDVRYKSLGKDELKKIQDEYISYHPWVLSVVAYFQLENADRSRQTAAFSISQCLEIPESIIRSTIQEMIHHKLLKEDSEKFVLVKSLYDFTQSPMGTILRQMHYWSEKLNVRIQQVVDDEKDRKGLIYFSDLRVSAVSEASFSKINEIILESNAKIIGLLNNPSGPKSRLICLFSHFFQPNILSKEKNFEHNWKLNKRK